MLRLSQRKICLFLFSAKRATKKKSSHEALQSWLINTEVYHLLVKNNKGGVGGLLTFFLGKGELIRERGIIWEQELNRRFKAYKVQL